MIIQQEIDLKIERVRELMQRLELDAVLFRRQASFAWLNLRRARNMVGIATEIGAASILVTADRRYVLCNAVEQTRIAAEERVEDMGYEIRSWPWNHDEEAALARGLGGKAVGCDVPFADFRSIGGRRRAAALGDDPLGGRALPRGRLHGVARHRGHRLFRAPRRQGVRRRRPPGVESVDQRARFHHRLRRCQTTASRVSAIP